MSRTENATGIEDAQLLRRYAEEKSEAAFAELVRRHLTPVYSFALRRVGGDAHLAQDVAQLVFTALARKAPKLTEYEVLGGWLCRAAHFAARDVVRAESRRRSHHEELHLMHVSSGAEEPVDWEKVAPVLAESLGELSDRDRDAVWLRFFEEKSFGEIGARWQIGENGARMRVERALEKLQRLLTRRGITSTASALSAVLANHAVVAAPVGLAATVTGAALGAASATGVGAAAGWLIFMSTSKWLVGVAAGVAVVGLGTAYVATGQAREAEAHVAVSTSRVADANARLAELQRRADVEAQRVERAESVNARLLKQVERRQTSVVTAAALPVPVTSDVVQARMERGRELVRAGDYAAALAEFLWCFDVGYKEIRQSPVRLSFGLGEIVRLATLYPPARDALLERRQRAQQAMLADDGDRDAVAEFSALTRELKDGAAFIPLLESWPAGDSRRRQVADAAREALVETQRYAFAAEALSYGSLSSILEMMGRRPESRDFVVQKTATDIEILAGAGRLEEARTLGQRVIALDGSEATRALLQRHLARAGHPHLLSSTTEKP
jgi:RNA polymerase sigma factor (sigma-70 family)